MAIKYWRLTLKGERSMSEAESLVGPSGMNLVRMHFDRGETKVYFATEGGVAADLTKRLKIEGALEPVSVKEVTKLG